MKHQIMTGSNAKMTRGVLRHGSVHSRYWGWNQGPASSEGVLPVLLGPQGKPLACPAVALPFAPLTDLHI